MKLIFDEDLPRDLPAYFESAEHKTVHVEELGWKGIRNGDLLARIEGEYDVLITGDTNMRFQQDLSRVDVAVLVLQPRRKLLDELVALVPRALQAIETAPRGQATIVQPE